MIKFFRRNHTAFGLVSALISVIAATGLPGCGQEDQAPVKVAPAPEAGPVSQAPRKGKAGRRLPEPEGRPRGQAALRPNASS